MHAYLSDLGDLAAIAIAWGVGAVLLLAGALLTGRRTPSEIGIGAGWGALCLVLTLWGVFLPITLRVPAIAFVAAALAGLLLPRRRPPPAEAQRLLRAWLASLPLWLVMAPIRPSQPDTFLNLLPNAVYLVDYGRFPTSRLPPSHSYLPAAPYDTQFLSFLGGLVAPGFPAAGMSLVNVLLLLASGLAIARALAGADEKPQAPLSWGSIALGQLLAAPLNPGFVPRINLSAFGETALMVTALFSMRLLAMARTALAKGEPPTGLLPLALILAAMVNAKQSAVGLVAAVLAAAALAGCAESTGSRRQWLKFLLLAAGPAALLYGVWRLHAARAGVAELAPLPPGAWHWAVLPQTIASAAHVIAEKPVYFGAVAIAILALPWALRRWGWTATTRLLALHAALFAFYNGFILLTYIVTFSGVMSAEAHSFFRYNTHLALVLVLALALTARDAGAGVFLARHARGWAAAALALQLALPVAFAHRLRFDLEMPQPRLWDLAAQVKPLLRDGERLALLLPGDNGSVAAMLAGVLRDVPPRRQLDVMVRPSADAAALDAAARAGFELALVSCSGAGLAGLPPDSAGLLARDAAGWHSVAAWPYPPVDPPERWQRILSWEPLCRKS